MLQPELKKKKEKAESKKKPDTVPESDWQASRIASERWSPPSGFLGISRWFRGLMGEKHAPEKERPSINVGRKQNWLPWLQSGQSSHPSEVESIMDKVLKNKSGSPPQLTQKGSNFWLPGVVPKDKSASPPILPPERPKASPSASPSGLTPSVGRASQPPVSVGRLPELDEEIEGLERLLRQRRKNIQILEDKKATYAKGEEPLSLLNQIESEKEKVGKLDLQIPALKEERGLRKRYETEVVAAVSLHMISAVAQKGSPGFAKTLAMREEIMNPLFDHHSLLLGSSGVNLARQFQVRADLESKKRDQLVSAKELIRREIEDLESLSPYHKEYCKKTELLQWRLHLLRQAEQELESKQQLPEDVWSPIPPDAIAKALPQIPGIDDRGVCFQLDEKRRLRITVHKPSTEDQQGSFSIYESYSETNTKVRIVCNYCRIWTSNQFNFFENSELLTEIGKISDACRSKGLCDHKITGYRLPYCIVFLSTIDEHVLHDPSKSNALHIPICIAHQSADIDIVENSIPYWMFEELFNRGMLGSDWLEREWLLYLHKFLASLLPAGTFIFQTQEYSYPA